MDISSATIVLAAATICVPILSWGLTSVTEVLRHEPISRSRRSALCRNWNGHYRIIGDIEGTVVDEPPTNINISFSSKGRKLTGAGNYENTNLIVEGYLKNDHVLVLDYKNVDNSKFHFGSMLLLLNADVNRLTGYLLGYGRDPDGPLVAYVELRAI